MAQQQAAAAAAALLADMGRVPSELAGLLSDSLSGVRGYVAMALAYLFLAADEGMQAAMVAGGVVQPHLQALGSNSSSSLTPNSAAEALVGLAGRRQAGRQPGRQEGISGSSGLLCRPSAAHQHLSSLETPSTSDCCGCCGCPLRRSPLLRLAARTFCRFSPALAAVVCLAEAGAHLLALGTPSRPTGQAALVAGKLLLLLWCCCCCCCY